MLYKKLRWIIASMSLIVTTFSFSQNMYIKTYMGLYGNTGFRGSILPSEEDSLIVVNDFYIIQFKVLTNCTVVVDSMEVKKADKTYMLKPTFLDCTTEMKVVAGEIISVRAEKNDDAIEIELDTVKTSTLYKGKLSAKVNGQPVVLTVKDFESIFTK